MRPPARRPVPDLVQRACADDRPRHRNPAIENSEVASLPLGPCKLSPEAFMNKDDPREALRRIIARHPKAATDPEKLWRVFVAEIYDSRELEAAVLGHLRVTWFPEAMKQP
jgi:hypothetical protein